MFVENERAIELLHEVIEKNPNWLMCHAILADAWIHRGNISGDDAFIELAYNRSAAVLDLMDDNPFALGCGTLCAQIENREASAPQPRRRETN